MLAESWNPANKCNYGLSRRSFAAHGRGDQPDAEESPEDRMLYYTRLLCYAILLYTIIYC
eukprot:8733762-Heterocapsa_arctica.AAC.1